jgi:putative hydrolase of the HAD superfamily
MIENIIFDFGYALAYPRSGNWFLTPESKKFLTKGDLLRIVLHYHRKKKILATTHRHLNEDHLMHTQEKEIEHFQVFYQKILTGFGVTKGVEQKSAALAQDLVLNDERIGIYEDVLRELPILKTNYRIGILSDNWPSLRRLLTNYRIEEHLNGLIISSDYGICKDNVQLFQIAVDELKIKPECSVFVDDSEKNLTNAEQMGFHSILMDRKRKVKNCIYPIAHNLQEVAAIVDKMNKGGGKV